VVLAPVAVFVTVTTVPKGSVGLAQRPGGASAYHVAWPLSLSPGAGDAVGATVCATTGAVVTGTKAWGTGATVVVVVGGGAVVVVVVGAVTVVVVVAPEAEAEE
jgi:hypothetical protein